MVQKHREVCQGSFLKAIQCNLKEEPINRSTTQIKVGIHKTDEERQTAPGGHFPTQYRCPWLSVGGQPANDNHGQGGANGIHLFGDGFFYARKRANDLHRPIDDRRCLDAGSLGREKFLAVIHAKALNQAAG